MKKRLLSLALALALCMGLLAVPASAASAVVVKTFSRSDYTEFGPHSEGLIGAYCDTPWDNQGWTFIDIRGNSVTSERFSRAYLFSEGLAAVQPQGETAYGYIDTEGDLVIPCRFSEADFFHNGLARVQDAATEKWGVIDKTGKTVVPFQYDYRLHGVSDGMIAVYDEAQAYWGYMDTNGRMAIPVQYAEAGDFADGFAEVSIGRRKTVIDKTGREIIPQQYHYHGRLTDDSDPLSLFIAGPSESSTGEQYVLNGSGQVLAGPYYQVDQFYDGYAVVVMDLSHEGYSYGYIDTTGREVIPLQYSVYSPFIDGSAVVKTADQTPVIIDKAGRITATLTEEQYGVLLSNRDYNWSEGMFVARDSESGRDRWGYINAAGQQVVPCKYQSVQCFSCGVGAVGDFSGKWGLVNAAGQEIMPCKYNEIGEFVNGITVANVAVDGNHYDLRYGLIDASGREVIPCKYDGIDQEYLFDALEKGDRDIYLTLTHEGGVDLVHITNDYTAPAQPTTPAQPETPVTPTVGGFTDVAETSPFKDAILWAVDQGITNGTSGTTFSPSNTCTVRQILTFLYRAAGKPGAVSGQNDLDAAVAWATAEGILPEGADSTAACTRSMAVEFMWKAAGSPEPSQSAAFDDVSAGAAYADAVAWAVENGITNGTGGNNFSPENTCTRGQIVTFLYRNK